MTAESPLVSVIVPVYNARRYLDACVQSLRAQTEQNIEILLVDDGSTDGSGELCDRLAAGDGRIVVCHQTNGGVSAARNKGLELARGKYIMFCDSDDAVLPRYCQAHLEAMAQPGVGLTIALNYPLPEGMEPMSDGRDGYLPDYRLLLKLWKKRWLWYCWGKCFDGDILRRTGLRFDSSIVHSEDTLFVVEYIMELLGRPGRIYLWQEQLYLYYDTPNSLAKDMKAMGNAMERKLAAAQKLGQRVGLAQEEVDNFLDADRIWVTNNELRAQLAHCKWYQLSAGCRKVKEVMASPAIQEMLRTDARLRIFGNRYRRVLNGGNPVAIYLYFNLWRIKDRMSRSWVARHLLRRKLIK